MPEKGAPIFPEFGLNWVINEIEEGVLGYCEIHTHDYFSHIRRTYKELKEIPAVHGRANSVKIMCTDADKRSD